MGCNVTTERPEAMMKGFKTSRAKAMVILGLSGIGYLVVFWLAAAFGLLDHSWGKLLPIAVGVALVLAAYKQVDRTLDKR